MLKSIKLKNYTTFFGKPTEIDFSAKNYKILEDENVGENRILKGALFVGENASGKTQILKSIKLLLDVLFANRKIDYSNIISFYTEAKEKTVKFEYTFVENNSEIKYTIEFDYKGFKSEKLIVDNKEILDRIDDKAKLNLKGEKTFSDIPSNLSLLRRVYFDTNFYEDETLTKWFEYLKNSTYINCIKGFMNYDSIEDMRINNYVEKNTTDEINKFFKEINYRQKIKYDVEAKTKRVVFRSANANEKFISFSKDETDTYIPIKYESIGNKVLLNILPAFLNAIKKDSMIIIDEFSSGLHNELEECLLKYFFHYSKNSQIFFVSHSTNILNNTLIRPDQVYSTEFNPKKGTVLTRFSDEKPRESQNTEKMYLNGVFNGIPRYNKTFKN